MSALNLKQAQIGKDADPTKNFILKTPTIPDGSLLIARGSIGAEIKDVLKINPDGGVMTFGPAFRAIQNTVQNLGANGFFKVALAGETYDNTAAYNPATGIFNPKVKGWYKIGGSVRISGTNITHAFSVIYKNGAQIVRGTELAITINGIASFVSAVDDLIYFNGTTDYVELYGYITATSGWQFDYVDPGICSKFFGYLVEAA